jgi:Ca2+-binding EF-hand superfamily protein
MMRNSMKSGSVVTDHGHHARLRADFDSNDVNHDGRLTLGEFIRFMENSNEEMTTEECQAAFDEIDTDSDGLIDFAHLLAWWNERA